MDHEPGRKESAYTPEMGELILARIAAGETVKQITADPRMPAYATVYRWTHMVPEFGEAWRTLRAQMAADAVWMDAQKATARHWMRAHTRRMAGKPPRDWVSGQRSTYTPQAADAVCQALVMGASLSEVVARPDMPSFKAIYRWLRNEPEFRAMYARACALREDLAADRVWDMAHNLSFGGARMVRRQAEAMMGQVGRMTPRKYRAGFG